VEVVAEREKEVNNEMKKQAASCRFFVGDNQSIDLPGAGRPSTRPSLQPARQLAAVVHWEHSESARIPELPTSSRIMADL
jgi:hypothetical protein